MDIQCNRSSNCWSVCLNIGNVTADYKGTPVTDEDPSHYFGSSTAIDIEKYTNGEDADNAPGPYVGIGSTVTWTYNVTNTGNVNLTSVVVSDNMGVIPTYVSGDNGNSILEVGESWIYNATGVATAGQYANIGNVTADYKGTPVTDEDPSHYFGSSTAIDIEKYTNGEDADNAPGPYVGIGSTVTWTYNVTNTGNVNLTSVVVSDNMGVIPTYVSGDNGNSILEVGESWIYNATGVATAGQYANIGNVTADYKGTPVTDEDPSHYFGSSTAIDIEKYTNGEDADNAPGPYVGIGSTVTWTYNVTNTGNVNLTSVVVSDNMGVIPTYVSGDNGNSILEVGESWIYNATGVATAGQYANIGNVTADYKGTPVTDEDPSHYFGSSTAIDIEKYTNGEDADNAPGPYVGIGSTVTWTYNVTNTGNVNLTSVVVSDNMGVIPTYVSGDNGNSILEVGESWIYNATGVATAGQYANIGNVTADYKGTPVTDEDPSHYFGSSTAIDIEKYTNGEDADNAPGPYVGIGSTVTWTYNVTNTGNVNLTSVVVSDNMGVIPTYVSGDNGNSILEVGESWIYNATGVATAGQYANIGNVTADYKGTPVTDEDPSHYFGSSTAIDIEKYTNGEDADNAPGPYVGIGSTVTWTYNVTNTGNVNLTSVVVSDNMGVIPTYVSGDNGNSILEVGESWIYNATGVATAGQYANIGNVTADYKGTPVTDEDPSHYFGSSTAIDIEKYTNGEDADNAPGPYVGIGSTVTWTYNVTNTGNVNLTSVVVSDNMGVIPTYVSGDNGNSILEVGESWIYNATGVATAGQYANIGNVTADYKGTPVTDEDPSHYFGSSTAIDIEKYTNGEDADNAPGPYVGIGSTVTWTYNVTNTGNVNLTSVVVSDNMGVIPTYVSGDNGNSILEVGESWIYNATGVATAGQYANIGNVTADYKGTPVTDEDPSHYFGSSTAIDIEKYTNGEDADNAPGPYVGIGSTVTWTYNVTNTGNVNLTSVVVSDNMGVIPTYVSGDNGNSILEVGESWIYNATGVATAGQYANIGNVTADYKGTPVTDEDPSHYFGSSTAIDIEKYTNGEDADNAPGPYVGIGSTVTWTYNVTNTGNVNLTSVVVSDNMGVIPTYVSGDNGNSILEVGESWIYNATGVATAGQYANIGNVTADYKGTPVTDEDPSHYFGSSTAIDIEKYTNGEDADNAPGPYVGIGSTVTWTYNVTNTGNVNLTSVVVSDNMGVIPTYVSGDNGNSILEVGESWIYNATGVATAGQYANIGNVTADYKGTPVTDEDPSHYFGSSTAIDIEKYTNGEDADNAPGPYVGIGSTVTWTYNVTNTGNVNLTSVVVSDNMGVIPTYVSGDNGNSILEVGESWIYNATGVATAGQYANIGNVTADYKGTPCNR
ncbi:hypothetical protein [uncultured Methanomethylovorans sp.]|uniref:beta strand repeat-containing protein n=1 Tax=uncultured Methanomethylovorans sp. TaxID=183759 RepID=UPI002AA6A21D|nr:hypothetical protein [uncultured Methanomethylovorans sp.]